MFVEGAPAIAAQHQSFVGVLNEVHMAPDSVVKILCGFNGLHPHLLKACSAALCLPFYLLSVKSLNEGVLPNLWKTSLVAPCTKMIRDVIH